MGRSLNKVTLIGNLGGDPEIRSTTGGKLVATFSLATSREWKGRGEEKQEKTEWHRIVVWGKLCDVVEKHVKKGDKIYVEGSIEYRQWTDKENNTRYTTEINVQNLLMLGGVPKSAKDESRPAEFEDFPGANGGDIDEDDLPF